MKKSLVLVGMLASLSFGSVVEIGIPVADKGWDHYNATLIGINLQSYLQDYTAKGEVIESAVLKFTGVQNYMEPEENDVLYMDLLKYNLAGSEQQKITYLPDDQNPSNYFKSNLNGAYTWLGDASDLGSYTDKNDKGKIEYEYKVADWQKTKEHNNEITNGKKNGYYWRWENGGWVENTNKYAYNDYTKQWEACGILWSKYSGWKTEDFDKVLDVALVDQLMTSSKGWIGIGLDADCHYTGNVKLVVTTKPTNVPEPGSLSFMLLGLTSLTGVVFVRKRK